MHEHSFSRICSGIFICLAKHSLLNFSWITLIVNFYFYFLKSNSVFTLNGMLLEISSLMYSVKCFFQETFCCKKKIFSSKIRKVTQKQMALSAAVNSKLHCRLQQWSGYRSIFGSSIKENFHSLQLKHHFVFMCAGLVTMTVSSTLQEIFIRAESGISYIWCSPFWQIQYHPQFKSQLKCLKLATACP